LTGPHDRRMMRIMRVTFLGTGTSHGVPMIGCACAVCRSDNPRNQRLRPSVLVETGATRVLVDATPDFRAQALRAGLRALDAVLLTHTHADHFFGLDDLRAFTERTGQPMPIYGSAESLADVRRVFPYACTEKPAWTSLPHFTLREVEPDSTFQIGELEVRSVELPHGRTTVLGFVFGRDFAYLTDCNAVAPAVVRAIHGVTALALDGLRHRPHPTHLTIADAVAVARQANAKRTWLTHMSHDVEHDAVERELPPGVNLAYDGLQIEVNDGECRPLD
jgi:phosphoribosyl 1,2-cyclic phosphate phosphodiesterase